MHHRRPSEARGPVRNFVYRSHFVQVGLVGERASRSGLCGVVTTTRSDGMVSHARDAGAGRVYVRQGEATQLLWRKA